MEIALWIAQALLALMFLFAGFTKTFQSQEKLATAMPWTTHFPMAFVRFVGIVEILGAIGLILPPLVGIAPVLVPIAAIGLVLTMVGAMIYHVSQKEFSALGMNIILLLIAAFIAWGRFGAWAF